MRIFIALALASLASPYVIGQDTTATATTGSSGAATIFVPQTPAEAVAHKLKEGAEGKAIYEQACASVVKVEKSGSVGVTVGSGFFIDEDGLLVTVIPTNQKPDLITVTWQEKPYMGKLLTVDPNTRLALVKIEATATPKLVLSRGFDVPLGAKVYAVSESTEALHRLAEGRLAGREGTLMDSVLPTTILRLNLSADSEAFGAPVLNAEGRVAAVLLLDFDDDETDVCFALPSEITYKVWADYKQFGQVEPSWLGFTLERGTSTPKIVYVRKGSPAANAGLVRGDVIMRIDDRHIRHYQDVVDKCYYLTAGREVEIDVLRGTGSVSAKVTPIAVSKLREIEEKR
jgi:S1-C subfamily serine protease